MRRSVRSGVFVALAFTLVAAAFALVPARADVESFTLYGSMAGGWGFTATTLHNPGPPIVVTQGDSLALTLHSVDGLTHSWFVDYNNNSVPDTGEPSSPDFTGSTAGSYTFTADRVGTFLYRCRYHPSTMTGVIVIRTPPTFELYGDATRGWGAQNTTAAITSPGPSLRVNQSDTVIIDLTSVDGQPHSWFIDLNNDSQQQASEPHSADFTSSVRFTFTATQAGTFTYRCRFHPVTMRGTITVQSTGGGTTPVSNNNVLIIGGVIIVIAIVAVAAAIMMRRKKPQP